MAQFRQAPARFFEDAPAIVKAQVLDIIAIKPAAPLDFDVIFRQEEQPRGGAAYGLDFGNNGASGCHFYLMTEDMRDYRNRMRRKRVAWSDLPVATQKAIVAYLESDA